MRAADAKQAPQGCERANNRRGWQAPIGLFASSGGAYAPDDGDDFQV
jgi:hypothetical protein